MATIVMSDSDVEADWLHHADPLAHAQELELHELLTKLFREGSLRVGPPEVKLEGDESDDTVV